MQMKTALVLMHDIVISPFEPIFGSVRHGLLPWFMFGAMPCDIYCKSTQKLHIQFWGELSKTVDA